MKDVQYDNRVVDAQGRTIVVHNRDMCTGRPCVIHSPSEHKTRDWPMNFRFDKMALVERLCTHGVGHPDPDSVHYFETIGVERMGIHGCDGCCGTA